MVTFLRNRALERLITQLDITVHSKFSSLLRIGEQSVDAISNKFTWDINMDAERSYRLELEPQKQSVFVTQLR